MNPHLQALCHMAQQAKRAQYPNVPPERIPKAKYTDKDANGLTRCILDYLTYSGAYAVRINTQGQYRESLGKWTQGQTRKGTADVHACFNGCHLSIEVKAGKDKMSGHQRRTQQMVEQAGGRYFVARNFTEFFNWFQSIKNGRNLLPQVTPEPSKK